MSNANIRRIIKLIIPRIKIYLYFIFHSFRDNELNDIRIYFLRKGLLGVRIYPYNFIDKYNINDIVINRDTDGFPYVIRNGKRLYGKQSMSDNSFKYYYKDMLKEQDLFSPHCYIGSNGNLETDRLPESCYVIADIGAAEGFWALDNIDKVKKVYLIEYDAEWVSALKKTFLPWKNKVVFVEKLIGNTDNETTIMLDTLFADKELDYLKADIEGCEEQMIEGGKNTFSNKIQKCLLCAYHKDDAENMMKKFLKENGFSYRINSGYMLYDNANTPPYFRRGVIFGYKD